MVYIWHVVVLAEYTKGFTNDPDFDVAARNLDGALRKISKLVDRTIEDLGGGPDYRLKRYQIKSAVRGNTLDA